MMFMANHTLNERLDPIDWEEIEWQSWAQRKYRKLLTAPVIVEV